jgi:ABC-type oligopeptide transport system ATPase subunit
MPEPLLRAEALTKAFPLRGTRKGREHHVAVDGVSFHIDAGETLAVVGESGCGKSTTASMVARLVDPTSGAVHYGRTEVTGLSRRRLRPYRPLVQMVFQDPYSALDPRMTCRQIVSEPLKIQGRYHSTDSRRIDDLLDRVGLDPSFSARKPGGLSGGQRQRIGIARALALSPEVVVLDEPVSALDASIQAQVLNLLQDLQRDTGVSYLFISHDLAVVRHIANRLLVMHQGKVVEEGASSAIFADPQHPYTQRLISAVPVGHPSLRAERREDLHVVAPA